MVNLTINDQKISVKEGTTILEAAREVGIDIPHLCYLEGINEIGACRVCIVENVGMETLITACNTPVEEGMQIYTNSPKVRKTRRINVDLILSDHDCKCATCVRSGNCNLQKIANDLGILENPYENIAETSKWNSKVPLIRDASKCIKCMRCIQICDKVQGMNVWDISGSGYRTTVGVSHNEPIEEADCAFCGQCITHCPVGALRERNDTDKMLDALADPEKITMVHLKIICLKHIREKLSLELTLVLLQRRLHLSVKTAPSFILSITEMTGILLAQPFLQLKKSTARFQQMLRLFTPALPVMEKL